MRLQIHPDTESFAYEPLHFDSTKVTRRVIKAGLLKMAGVFLGGIVLSLWPCTYSHQVHADERGKTEAMPDYLSGEEIQSVKVYRAVVPS
ncbi:MAG: hypothetical protein P8Y00_05980, partial [Deltaproteobacteria bacterium]